MTNAAPLTGAITERRDAFRLILEIAEGAGDMMAIANIARAALDARPIASPERQNHLSILCLMCDDLRWLVSHATEIDKRMDDRRQLAALEFAIEQLWRQQQPC